MRTTKTIGPLNELGLHDKCVEWPSFIPQKKKGGGGGRLRSTSVCPRMNATSCMFEWYEGSTERKILDIGILYELTLVFVSQRD